MSKEPQTSVSDQVGKRTHPVVALTSTFVTEEY